MKLLTLDAAPYDVSVHVCIASARRGIEWLCEHRIVDDDLRTVEGRTYILADDADIYIWCRTQDVVLLSHELLHAAVAILSSAGVPISPKHDEALAYLHSHLLQQALEQRKTTRKTA